MADIFLCYSSQNRDIALRLDGIFRDKGWSVFMDTRIHAGKRFHIEIEKELKQARAAVALWSKAARESDYVLEEAEDGKQRGILVPLRVEAVDMPYGFRRVQTADLIDWDG